jgi:uncharacterized membrane protein YphA (DoxX/SURF4 family)
MTEMKTSKGLHIGLWAAQGLLATMLLIAGFMKATQPINQLVTSMPWAADMSPVLFRIIGVIDILGALGLILPSALRIYPKLTVYAALGIILLMLGASKTHYDYGEYTKIGATIFNIFIAAFIGWGRFKKEPIQPKA